MLRELVADDNDNDSPGESLGEVVDASGSPPVGAAANRDGCPEDLPRGDVGRGQRFTVRELSRLTRLGELGLALAVDWYEEVTVAKSIKIKTSLEWTSDEVSQYVRGAASFNGPLWYSHIFYQATAGVERNCRWGQVRWVLRGVSGQRRDAVVVWRMRDATPRPGCVLMRYRCKRLAWKYGGPTCSWPKLEVVPIHKNMRLEQVHMEFADFAERHGLGAMPSTAPVTSAERWRARFFTNAFYPWMSRVLSPGARP